MKATPKLVIASICALAFSGVLLAGCSSSSADQEILDKLNQMETEIAELHGQAATDDQQTEAPANDAASGDAAANDAAATASAGADLETTIADLESRAAAAVETANGVAVPQNAADRPQAYFDAKAPLETLEHEADQLEDQLEAQYRQGSLDRETFWSYDHRVSAVEDSLDNAGDQLELRMGVDG